MDPQEARIYIAIIITAIVIGAILVYFALAVIGQQKRNIQLQKEGMKAELSAMEKERTRIAADLHDDLGPLLSVVKFQVDHAIESGTGEELRKAGEHIDSLIDRMREIATNLMPTALLRKGLIEAIEEFINNASKLSDLQIQFIHDGSMHLKGEINAHLFRTVQELIQNCIKHANANIMELRLEIKNNELVLLYRDNGKGFDYETANLKTNGMGLRSLKNRTEIMGGSLVVESKENVGTAFLFTIPIK